MTGLTSVVSAQALLAAITLAITLTYGLAFLGLWLQYRREVILAFALAWLGLGLYSAISVAQLLVPVRPASEIAFLVAIAVVGVCTALSIVNAAYWVVEPARSRRRLWQVGVAVLVVQLAMVGFDAHHETSMRLIVVASLAWGFVVSVRAQASPGRRSMIAALALLLLRPIFGLMAPLWTPAQQPLWHTILQLLVTLSAGFLATVAVFAIERDAAVRERAALERGLAQSQRMDSMGRMASSVAHDFNNILMSVMAASEFAGDERATPAERREAQTDIMGAARKGKELTQRLLSFARPGAAVSADFDPARRTLDLLPLIERLVGRQIAVSCAVAEALRAQPTSVRADPVQFDQVLLNVAANARDAMPQGGALRLHCDVVASPRVNGEGRALSGAHVRLAITDTGAGMTPETAERVFEPFFTTKDEGKGTGLGLAAAFAFAKQAQGAIAVESAVGQGSTFSIYLPVVAATPSP